MPAMKQYHREACFDPEAGEHGQWRSIEDPEDPHGGIGMKRKKVWDETVGVNGGYRSFLCSEIPE